MDNNGDRNGEEQQQQQQRSNKRPRMSMRPGQNSSEDSSSSSSSSSGGSGNDNDAAGNPINLVARRSVECRNHVVAAVNDDSSGPSLLVGFTRNTSAGATTGTVNVNLLMEDVDLVNAVTPVSSPSRPIIAIPNERGIDHLEMAVFQHYTPVPVVAGASQSHLVVGCDDYRHPSYPLQQQQQHLEEPRPSTSTADQSRIQSIMSSSASIPGDRSMHLSIMPIPMLLPQIPMPAIHGLVSETMHVHREGPTPPQPQPQYPVNVVATHHHRRQEDEGWQESRMSLLERANFLLNNSRMSDIKFLVGEGKVEVFANKTLLAMGSPVFEAQFFGPLKTTSEVIELPDIDPQTFLLFLKYLYTDTLSLDEEVDDTRLLNLLRPAKKYIVPHLIEKCSDILMSELKPENVFQVHNYAEFFDLPKLTGACLRFIDREADAIARTEEFNLLTPDILANFLRRDGLNISEIDLFKAIVRWAELECERNNLDNSDANIRSSLGANLQLIRFATMSPSEFATEIAHRNILTAEEARSIFIFMCAGYQHRLIPGFIPSFPTNKRGFYPQQYLVSRFSSDPVPHSLNYRSGEIYTYRFNSKADRQIFLKGVNIFSIKCGTTAQYPDQRRFNGAVYLYECDPVVGDRDLTREKARKQFSRDGALEPEFETSSGSRFYPVVFDNEIRIPANQTFTICAVVSVASSSYQQQPLMTFMGNDEITETSIRCADDLVVNFTFSNCNGETSVGKYTQSQIPEIVFSL